MDVLALILAILFFVAGFAFIVFPVLPGTILILAGIIVYGLMTGIQGLGIGFILGQVVAAALGVLADYLAGIWAVKKYGGSRRAVWGSIIGGIVGVFLLGPLGIILGPFLGAVGGEALAGRALNDALKTGIGTLIGFMGGAGLKLAIGVVMVVWFFLQT